MLKVLISAYACEPHKGSEPGVGWNWAKQIAKFAKVWVITRANNRDSIEKALEKEPISNLHFVYVDLPKWMRFWKKGEMGIRLYYFVWQICAYFKARKLHKKINFDLVHHITFLVDWLPSFMCFLPVPFVWGPIGGTSRVFLSQFLNEFGFNNSIYEVFRFFFLNFLSQINPLLIICKKKASAILVSTIDDFNYYKKKYGNKVYLMSAIGIDDNEVKILTPALIEDNQQFKIFTAGRHVHWKGHSLALKSFYYFQKKYPNAIFYIAGKGPETKKIQKLVSRLGLDEKVRVLGYLSNRNEIFRLLSASDVFILPTLRDAPLVSFLEAMCLKISIICADIPGQRDIVQDDCGIRVKMLNPAQITKDLTEALLKLVNDPELRRKMGEAGRERVLKHYTWEQKGKFIKRLYHEISETCMDS